MKYEQTRNRVGDTGGHVWDDIGDESCNNQEPRWETLVEHGGRRKRKKSKVVVNQGGLSVNLSNIVPSSDQQLTELFDSILNDNTELPDTNSAELQNPDIEESQAFEDTESSLTEQETYPLTNPEDISSLRC